MAKRAESFFIAADETKESNEELTIDQKIKQFSINNRPKFMELPSVVGVHTAKGNNVTAIILRTGKDFNGWKESPKWLKVAENSPKSAQKFIKGFYNVVDSTGNVVKVDNENVLVILQSEEADINVESLKKAINDIGPTKKYSYYNYTKAQNYFLEFVQTGSNNDKIVNKPVEKLANLLRTKVMGLNNVHGINVQQFKNIDYLTIVARVGKGYKPWTKTPSFLKKPEKEVEFKDATVLDQYVVYDEDKPVKIDDKLALLVVKEEHIEIDALKPATNDIGATKKHDYKNYTKAQSFFIDYNDDENEKKLDSTDSKIRKVSIENRPILRNINGVIGVKTQRCKGVDKAVIVLRVGKDFKTWEKIPAVLATVANQHQKDAHKNIKGWYNLLNKDGKKITVDDAPVLVCTLAEKISIEIDSLKSPQNKINSSKKAQYSKAGHD